MKYAEYTEYKTNIGSAQNIYICLHLCLRIHKGSRPSSMHVPAKWCFLAKGVTSSLSPRAQNDIRRHTIFKIWEFPAADCVAHGASFLGQFVFQPWNWSSLYQMDHQMDYRPPETSTANHLEKKNTLWVASRWSFLDLGVFCGLQDTNCWFHGSMGFHGETVSPRCLTWLLGAPTGPLT